jgi:pimeloyl-ACP methyl ester carboxylesterase
MAKINGVDLHFEVSGPVDGPPVLIVMGFASQMTSWPEEFHEGLAAEGFHVIRFDNRDVGLTHKFHGQMPDFKAIGKAMAGGTPPPVPYTLSDMADDGAALLDHLGIGSAHILGASMGGMIAQLIAIRHPAKTRSLISLMSTTSDPTLPRSDAAAQEALMTKPPAEDKHSVVEHAIKGRRALEGVAHREDEASLRARFASNYDRSYYPEGPVRQWAAVLAAGPRTEALKALRVPTLVLHGSHDALIKPEAGKHTAECVPGAQLHIIEGWGHSMPHSVISIIHDRIVPFVRDVETRRAEELSAPVAPGCCGVAAGH